MTDKLTPTTLRNFINEHYSLDQVRTLCTDCGVDYEQLAYDTRESLVRELIRELVRLERLSQLVRLVQTGRSAALFSERFGQVDPEAISSWATGNLTGDEQRYRKLLRDRYDEIAAYFIPLAAQTSEVVSDTPIAPVLQQALRHRQKIKAEYHALQAVGQEIKRIKLETLREGVDKYKCIILLGEPGSGKTTVLNHLAYELADDPEWLPLPLRLSEFGPGLTVEEFIQQSWGGSVRAGYWDMPALAAKMEDYLEVGRLFVLFDALNEMPHQGYKERVQHLRRFIDHWQPKGNRFLVTCRVLDYGEELSGLQRVEVQPFNDDQIKAFIQNVLPDNGSLLWQELVKEKDKQRRLLELARNPYMLTMMVVLFAEMGHLGQSRAALMTDFTNQLLVWAEEKCEPREWLVAEVQREALSILAFEMQQLAGSGTAVETEAIKTAMPETVQPGPQAPPQPSPPDQVLKLAAGAHFIEMPGDRSSVRFYHQLLQEYFAARRMLNQDPAGLTEKWRWDWYEPQPWVRPEGNYDPIPVPDTTGWEETTILAAGLAPENDDRLVQTLIEINPVLAGRCLHEGQARVDKNTRQAVVEALLATIADPTVALRVRIVAGEVLGELGDPRLGVLVTIPAGEFLMGSDPERDKLAYDNEQPQHPLYLAEYQIGQYPLTNSEFVPFIEAGGYQERRWWTEAGWKRKEGEGWSEPRDWNDIRFNKPNQPVVGVSWYECVAYCRWLSAETGRIHRLATEAEWEKAARGSEGRAYPWGEEFEPSRLNAGEGEKKVWISTPVGIYPNGVSPYKAFDCAGNVWEWCATSGRDKDRRTAKLDSYPYQVQDEWSAEHLKRTDIRVVRGGSWNCRKSDARCARRYYLPPDGGYSDRGCRLVVPIS